MNFTALEIRLTSTIRSKRTVGPHRGSGWIFQTMFRVLRLHLKIAQCLLDQLVEIDLRLLHFRTSDAREGQQVVNQIPHPFCRLGNRRQMAETFFGKRRPGVFLQQFHEAQDMAQRRAQIVGDGITERFQFLVGALAVAPCVRRRVAPVPR